MHEEASVTRELHAKSLKEFIWPKITHRYETLGRNAYIVDAWRNGSVLVFKYKRVEEIGTGLITTTREYEGSVEIDIPWGYRYSSYSCYEYKTIGGVLKTKLEVEFELIDDSDES